MFDNANPYTLRTEVSESMTRYFISFIDGQATLRETEGCSKVSVFRSVDRAEDKIREMLKT